ncbi:dyslexia-associated protein KIAA0319 [Caerostris extrusa]|uniref:Dyslexia-associated protein KIAA0319 n=1 Tax=Caerostris extrusa TaxID=172846 RepID=A0AAV4NTH6_CAEEX|nr:dyslexia-associated protein KIAA0319 [Caerostris extrusa]
MKIPNECPHHEECIQTNNNSGICHCMKGYERNVQGICQLQYSISFSNLSITLSSPTALNESSSLEESLTENLVSVATSEITHLVVSAGDNVTLHLPKNEVILSAYAFMQPEGNSENLKYEWTLISHPKGDETGIMQDQNTKNLKLSKLRTGLYTFKVTVTSGNISGESMVNVTVTSFKQENKPPIAIIQPANVTLKLPNKDTVLDGSFSTDDEKNYSKGAWNSTIAKVTVQKETDYPPTANAESEVVIYLPQNEVTLNGNLSTDDKGIKSWEWKKSPDTDKAVDMEGTNGPYLHLSKLEIGVYKFVLKVTDTADQTSSTEVHLFVKPESNTLVANAGTNQKVTLPLHQPVILNGTASKYNIKTKKWRWEEIMGPKPAILINANTSVAEVTGLIPGYYQFMLTIYDEKMIIPHLQ